MSRKKITSARDYVRGSAGYHGHLDGGTDELNGKLGDPRERFIKWHPSMPESDWPAYKSAYIAGFDASKQLGAILRRT